MNNTEIHSHLESEAINHEIKKHVEEMYSPEKLTSEYINNMFGLENGELNTDEIDKLGQIFQHAGEILMRTNLEKGSFKNLEEVKKAIEFHTKEYSKFGAHDLVHVVVENNLENAGVIDGERKPAIPQFLQEESNNLQAIREEFPAVLWTPIGKQQPIFTDLLNGNSEEVISMLKSHYNSERLNELHQKFEVIDLNSFESITTAYTEILMYLTYEVTKKSNGFKGEELKEWEQQYLLDQAVIKESISMQVTEFISDGEFSQKGKGEKTEQLFIEQAYSLFKNYKQDKKIAYKNFIELSQDFIT